MLNKIKLTDFQTHRNTSLDLVGGINVITGQSNQGKSSIVRSLYWVFRNRPSGDEFINFDSNSCSVQLVCNNSDVIKRIRTKNKNKYVINQQAFNAVRTDVPDEIKEVLNITDTNIQLQDDPHFLISLSPSEAAKKLNKVVGIDIIDVSTQYVNKVIYNQNHNIKYIKKELDEEKKKLNKFKKLPVVQREYKNLKKIVLRKEQVTETINGLSYIQDNLNKFKNIEKDQTLIEKATKHTKKLQDHIQKITEIENSIIYSKKLIYKIQKINKILENKPAIIKAEEYLLKINKLKKELEQLHTNKNTTKAIHLINKQQQEVHNLERSIEVEEQKFEQLKKELKICPWCNKSLLN